MLVSESHSESFNSLVDPRSLPTYSHRRSFSGALQATRGRLQPPNLGTATTCPSIVASRGCHLRLCFRLLQMAIYGGMTETPIDSRFSNSLSSIAQTLPNHSILFAGPGLLRPSPGRDCNSTIVNMKHGLYLNVTNCYHGFVKPIIFLLVREAELEARLEICLYERQAIHTMQQPRGPLPNRSSVMWTRRAS